MKKSCTTKTPQSIMKKTDREGENVMQALFDAVNAICGKIQVVSDLFWEFPTNFGWYAAIPILGNFSLAIILLVGTGIFLTFRFRFIQVRKFKYGLKVLLHSKAATKTGISALAAFLLSTAMRVVTGKYSRCDGCDFDRWSGRTVLDVAVGVFRDVHSLCRIHAVPDF